LLTGLPAGERDASGEYPAGTLNQGVAARLTEWTRAAQIYANPPEEEHAADSESAESSTLSSS